jgi:hypothetical protein
MNAMAGGRSRSRAVAPSGIIAMLMCGLAWLAAGNPGWKTRLRRSIKMPPAFVTPVLNHDQAIRPLNTKAGKWWSYLLHDPEDLC